jgi:hydrogenase expression/formation protein HypC
MDEQKKAGGTGAEGADPSCHDDLCITCSDQAVPSRVVELVEQGMARVDTGAALEVVSVALVDAAPGDTVLVHAGEAIAVVARI